jgi:hypothetical protein
MGGEAFYGTAIVLIMEIGDLAAVYERAPKQGSCSRIADRTVG